jgi:L-histidine Nalpha-methyltransferase
MTATPNSALAEFHDLAPERAAFETAVTEGLSGTQKTLPCKFLYDERGSVLFERICEVAEYYTTRTEIAMLTERRAEIAELMGSGRHVIEFGSGASRKIRVLLDALHEPAAYTGVDISREHMLHAVAALAEAYPQIEVSAVCADYTRPFEVPRPRARPAAKRVGFFPGSTIGNFSPNEAMGFLKAAAVTVEPGGGMLIGVDLKKDPAVLEAAYDDAEGVTAAFNLNLLRRINRELGGDFDLDNFAHQAIYNAAEGRVEMHLRALRDQTVTVAAQTFRFRAGETIHTECSYKFTVDDFRAIAVEAGFTPLAVWTDAKALFSIHYIRAGDGRR